MSNLITIKNLHKTFGSLTAINNVSFSVAKGEVLGFLGPNGAGKTTTMRILTGFLPADKGSVQICNIDVLKNPTAAQKHIGYLPEGGPLYNEMTPASFLQFIATARKLSPSQQKERIEFVVEKLNIKNVINQPIETLSKGYKRRVALAQAILHNPQILILDEPTDGLDPNQKHEVRSLIKSMAKDKAIIISTHILEEVDAICTNTTIISQGKIVAQGKPEDIAIKSPRHNVVVIRTQDTSPDKILSNILQVKNVEKVSVEDNNTVIAFPKKGKKIITDIGNTLRQKKINVEEIYVKSGELNEAFRSLTQKH